MKNYNKINGAPVVNVAKCTTKTPYGKITAANYILFYTALQLQSIACGLMLKEVRFEAKDKTKRIKQAADGHLSDIENRAAKKGEQEVYEDSECDIMFRCLNTKSIVLKTMQVPTSMLELFTEEMEKVVNKMVRLHEKNEARKK